MWEMETNLVSDIAGPAMPIRRTGDCMIQGSPGIESESFCVCNAGYVELTILPRAIDAGSNLVTRGDEIANTIRQVDDSYRPVGADIDRAAVVRVQQKQQQPYGKICAVQVAANGFTGGGHVYGRTVERVAYEIADREVAVQDQTRADEGETPRADDVETMPLPMERREHFSRPLALAIGTGRFGWVAGQESRFWNAGGKAFRDRSVLRAGPCKQQTPNAVSCCKI